MPQTCCVGELACAPYLRELISMFATVTEDEWDTAQDPSILPPNSVLESLASHDSAFSKKLANVITVRVDINALIERLH